MMMLLAAAFFLPLFPASAVFNALYARASHPVLRAFLLLAWPQIGVYILGVAGGTPPPGVVPLALATAGLYALRMLATRDMQTWTAFLATGTWALIWTFSQREPAELHELALATSVSLVLLSSVAASVTRRFGAAYAGFPGGLAANTPRLAGVLAVAALIAVGTPPGMPFFVLLHGLVGGSPAHAVAFALVWFVWSWAAIRLIQGMLVGEASGETVADLRTGGAWMYALACIGLVCAGFAYAGGVL